MKVEFPHEESRPPEVDPAPMTDGSQVARRLYVAPATRLLGSVADSTAGAAGVPPDASPTFSVSGG